MTPIKITKLRQSITDHQKKHITIESDINQLNNTIEEARRKLEDANKQLSFKNRELDENKRLVWDMSRELDKSLALQKQKERRKLIEERLETQPTFDDLVQKELTMLLNDLREMNFNLGDEVSYEELWTQYQKLVEDKGVSRFSAIRVDAIGRYRGMLTSAIEKELDGGKVDLIEKRNLKLPIQNFLSNPHVKSDLNI
jgi:chromosome segregation ATPase